MIAPRLLNRLRVTAAVGLITLAGCNPVANMAAARQTVVEFHQKLDAGDFAGIYAASHAELKAATSERHFIALLEAVHRKLGKVESTSRQTWSLNSFNLKTNVVLQHQTKFTHGEATESFTVRIEGDKGLLLGYNISSLALITK